MKQADQDHEQILPEWIDEICARLNDDKPVRRKLPGGGMVNIDRLLPFLCIYRRNPQRQDAGTEFFVHAEAAFINAPGSAPVRRGLAQLVQGIASTAASRLGGFFILEIWSGLDSNVPQQFDSRTGELELPHPSFRIVTRVPYRPEGTLNTLANELRRIKLHRRVATAEVVLDADNQPPDMKSLISLSAAEEMNCHVAGLEIMPIYRDSTTGEIYPDVLRTLRRGVGRALKKAFFAYSINRTNVLPQHYFALGRRSLPKLVWEVDRQLAEISGQFKFLLQVTPINAERSWQEFREKRFGSNPHFEYRPLEVDPLLLKRRLHQIGTERIEDPTLSHLLRQTQDELDRQILMLSDLSTARFLPGSLQVFGGIEPKLLSLAHRILELPQSDQTVDGATLNAHEFSKLAQEEIRHYQSRLPSFTAQATVRDDIYSGLLCSGGHLLIGREISIPAHRANALLQHEVGTHLVSYYNGGQQPLRLLRVGLAGYDGLQEGLAVLAEYLVGGLNSARLRLLAARVVAVHEMVAGASLPETFRRLNQGHDLEPRQAFTVALRVYRGGGLTKDAVYLRGLCEVIRHIRRGGELEPLLVGKIAVDHIPVIKELQYRDVLKPVPILPRFLLDDEARERLNRVKSFPGSVEDLVCQNLAQSGDAS